jgi:hypothetical protein
MAAKQRVVEFEAKTVVPRIEQVYREILYSQLPQVEEAGNTYIYAETPIHIHREA